MKLKRYAPSTANSLEGLLSFFRSIINPFIQEVTSVLASLDFTDNFKSQKVELKGLRRLAGTYTGITFNHELGSEPRYFLSMNGTVAIKGVPWDDKQVTFFLDPAVYSVGAVRDVTIILFK